MAIRLAVPDDLPAIQQCAEHAYALYVARIGRKPAPMVADFASQIDQGLIHVAVTGADEVQGFAVFYPRGDHMHLENVAVSPEHQGQGVGRALVAHCEKSATSQELAAIELYTNLKMTENLTLYPALGYAETGRRQEDGFDRVYFRKDLG